MKLSSLTRYVLLIVLGLWPAIIAAAEDDQLDAAPRGSFTLVVIPDTQDYRGAGTKKTPQSTEPVTNEHFATHTRWIVDNLDRQRIVFVSHVGDIVDKNNDAQWEVAGQCMDTLHGRVPYGITVGNHDLIAGGDSSLFQKYFPSARFREFSWYGGTFEPDRSTTNISGNNADSFQLFSAEGLDFIILHLECNAPDDVLAWADSVLKKHADQWAIVNTHMDLGPIEKPKSNEEVDTAAKGKMRWTKVHGDRGNSAVAMWDKCFRKHATLFLILCGDQSRACAIYQRSTGDHGNTVHEMLSDYRSEGPVRLLRFLPADNEIRVITYDTTEHRLTETVPHVPERDAHQFTVPYAMRP
ncbi:MAG TPA: metallophosphoesterase [Pirellulales bacterium]|jgi:hypothetical protein|nr:metallophosphoesterase [Pirellulales bacterium]